MKTFWIVLAVIFGCGILCCGGVVFMGKTALEAGKKITGEATDFSFQATKTIGASWSPAAIKPLLSPSADPSLESRIEGYGKKLGKLKSVQPFSSMNFSANTMNGANSLRALATGSATFENGDATIHIAAIKQNDQWKIEDFTVNSPVLEKTETKI